ncbi:hypothetical protein F5B22DRAFT_651569 [Xylaria bambusicola]|uniref:uncharacterized protein n=1 Tax=Xylaria bambusicola TaxID=326684 RepID=UPI0020083B4F|nr:uncharacterized protein F5B22DRAFT_651569 [Xylaria bambusicola]KAI0505637.1 hypothetical protein F5B22DRAFT_651569 [Xylaria bambusicola]
MPSTSSVSSYSNGSYYTKSRSDRHQQTITSIPGRCIHPSKLGNMLQARFGNNYSVEMRADNYKISAGSKISYADIRSCY